MADVVDVKNINKVQLKERAEQMSKPITNAQELFYNRYKLSRNAKESNYAPDDIALTFEEFDNIPCITEKEIN